jgi:nitroreductase
MDTLAAIGTRCSLKDHISSRPVEEEHVRAVLDAARLAPSARNMQPWRFVVVQGREAVEALADAAITDTSPLLRDAPVIIVACARLGDDVTIDGKPYYLFDVGSAMQNLLLAATSLGLVTHLIARFDEAAVQQALEIPDDVRVIVLTPLAYPREGSYAEAAAPRLAERTRRGLAEIAFWGRWRG